MDDEEFSPTIFAVLMALRVDPYQFPVKNRQLAGARAAALTYRTKWWRLVYDVDEYAGEIVVWAFGDHAKAYSSATRRRKER